MQRLAGKVALVTGGNSGIGLAAARRLHGEGARLVIAARDKAKLDDAASSIGQDVIAAVVDVAQVGQIDHLFDLVAARIGTLDVLFLNAAMRRFPPRAAV